MRRKKKRLKMYAMFMALIIMISSEAPYVFAAENEVIGDTVPEDYTIGDMEVAVPNEETTTLEKELTVEELAVTITGEEPVIYDGAEAQLAAMSDDETGSSLYNWTVSGYLSKSGDYALYTAELPAGSYLQARLSVPNNNTIDYDLVLYDSALSVIKASDYITYLNTAGAIAESIGYKASNTETIYIGVFSSLGGSDTEAYTLEFSIATNYSEANEPNENAKEAVALALGKEGTKASISGALNSAIDNDWYSFTVLDNLYYNKIRLDMDFVSKTNDYNIEIYKNLSTDYYAMQLVAYGKGGEINLPVGSYFLRVVCTNTINNFNVGDFPTYKLTVSPVSKVSGIGITEYAGGYQWAKCEYAEGIHYRTYEVLNEPTMIIIRGWAYYMEGPNTYVSKNIKIDATILDPQWKDIKPEWYKVECSAVTGDNGHFEMKVYLNPPRGGLQYMGSRYLHLYDLMEVMIKTPDNHIAMNKFYYERQIN